MYPSRIVLTVAAVVVLRSFIVCLSMPKAEAQDVPDNTLPPLPDNVSAKVLEQVLPVKAERVSLEYEQCFNVSQQALDRAMSFCIVSTDAGDRDSRGICVKDALEKFENSLARCPVDTGWRAQP